MVITLEEAKLYLKVDGDEDDALISSMINAAEEICQDVLRIPLADFTPLPETVKQAALYALANLYEQRETADIKAVIEVVSRLLFAYRKAGW